MEKLIILDRDGTINIDPGQYISEIENFEFIPKSIDALKILQEEGYKLVVVTNQGGIGKGFYSEEQYSRLNAYFLGELKKYGIRIEKVVHCPHTKEDGCECRKPKTKLLEDYLNNAKIDLGKSYMIGDKTSDIEFGRNLGVKTILVKTGYGGNDGEYSKEATNIAKDLFEAVQFIIENERAK
jgi:D-glycero-D-manno-heptose 1,7-bisphosphate phosphatase